MSRSLEDSSITPKAPIILASGSESRKQMLEEAGIVFDVIVSETDEDLIKKKMLNKNGHIFFSTINRNLKSFILAILGAEYILNILPQGTHDYENQIKSYRHT